MLRDGTHGVFSTAKYVWFPAVVIVGSEITFVQRNPMSRTVERPRTMRESARATDRAARSDPVRYVKTAPTAGRRTMYVRIGNSINILEPSQPGERAARVRVDHPEERHGEEADREDQGELRHDFREALELGNVPGPGGMLHRAGEHEQDRRDNPVVEHLEDPALDADHREARGAQEDEPHVPDRAVCDQSL